MSCQRSTGLLSAPRPTLPTFALLLFCLLCCATCVKGCAQECICIGDFVSCYRYSEATLHNLPADLTTLVLEEGTLDKIPQGFTRRYSKLKHLEIRSSTVAALVNGTFSGMAGLDQLAILNCRLDRIEVGAFSQLEAAELLIYESDIGTIYSGAFSALKNVREFSMWSNDIGEVESGAFQNLSNFGSFSFFMNNVTTVAEGAFADVRDFDKVDVYQNSFVDFSSSSLVTALAAATSNLNVFSNSVPCECGSVRDLFRQEMQQFLLSQSCRTPDTGRLLRLVDVNVTALCAGQLITNIPFSSLSSTTTTTTPISTTYPSMTQTEPDSTSSTMTESARQTSSTASLNPDSRSSLRPSSFSGPSQGTRVMSSTEAIVFRTTIGDRLTSTVSEPAGGHDNGGLREGSSSSRHGMGAGVKVQSSVGVLMVMYVTGCLMVALRLV